MLKRAMEKGQKGEETLKSRLRGNEKSQLEDLLEAQSKISRTLFIENFIPGFQLEMRLGTESLDDNDGCLVGMRLKGAVTGMAKKRTMARTVSANGRMAGGRDSTR